jgi:hypothetical protein
MSKATRLVGPNLKGETKNIVATRGVKDANGEAREMGNSQEAGRLPDVNRSPVFHDIKTCFKQNLFKLRIYCKL